MKNEIVLYQSKNLTSHVEVRIDGDTVWLNRQQIAELFNRDIKTIGKHINNVFLEEELDKSSTVANFATVRVEGDRSVERQIEFYNLDVIISVGYRVKSKQGTQFRIWANKVLKDHLLKGYSFNQRLNRIEDNVSTLSKRLDRIDLQIETDVLSKYGIFFEGQMFDAYKCISDILRSAKKSVILLDNYIDDTVLMQLSKRRKGVQAVVFTKKISNQLKLDLKKHNAQYDEIVIKEFVQAHDRFLLIDGKAVYHIGASLKDAGKKWFAINKMDSAAVALIAKLPVIG